MLSPCAKKDFSTGLPLRGRQSATIHAGRQGELHSTTSGSKRSSSAWIGSAFQNRP